jgi:hypothetical protein
MAERIFYASYGYVLLFSIVLFPGVGLLLICWGVWGDRSKGRARCPKCWYDMRGSLPRLECPECGHDAEQDRQLYKDHTRSGLIVIGLVLPVVPFVVFEVILVLHRMVAGLT